MVVNSLIKVIIQEEILITHCKLLKFCGIIIIVLKESLIFKGENICQK